MRTRHDHMHDARGGGSSQDDTVTRAADNGDHVKIPDVVKTKKTGCAVVQTHSTVVNPGTGNSHGPQCPLSEEFNRAGLQGSNHVTDTEISPDCYQGELMNGGSPSPMAEVTSFRCQKRHPVVRQTARSWCIPWSISVLFDHLQATGTEHPDANAFFCRDDLFDQNIEVDAIPSFHALNGVNGEATNSDDMATPGGSFQAQARIESAKRAAQNMRNANASSNLALLGGGKVDKTKQMTKRNAYLECENERLHKLLDKNEPLSEESVSYTCVIADGGLPNALFQVPGQYGMDYHTRASLQDLSGYLAFGKHQFELVFQEEFCGQCIISGFGWAIISSRAPDNTKVVTLRPATKQLYSPGFRFKDSKDNWVTLLPKMYLIYEPVWGRINKEYKTARLNQSIVDVTVVNGLLGGSLTDHSNDIFRDTVECFIRYVNQRFYTMIENTETGVLVQNNANFISKTSPDFWSPHDSSIDLVDIFQPWQEHDIECSLPLDWEVRSDFTIVKNLCKSGPDIGPAADVDSAGHLIFRPGSKLKKRYRTRFFGFAGLNLPDFLEYNNSANNLSHGLKRLIGAKKGEMGYRSNAMKLAAHIARLMHNCLPDGKTVSVDTIFMELVGKRLNGSFGKYGDTRPYVDALLQRPSADASAAWLQKQVRIQNNLSATTVRGFTAKLRLVDSLQPSQYTIQSAGSLPKKWVYDCESDELYEQREFIAKVMVSIWERSNLHWITRARDALLNGGHWLQYTALDGFYHHFASIFPREVVAEIAHVKKELRRRYVDGVKLSEDTDVLVNRLDVLIKRELAKFGKAPRLYVAYGEGCVYANELPEYAKYGIDGRHLFTHKGVTCVINIMSKPKKDSLPEIFTELYDAMATPDYLYIAIYSDDMCLAGNIFGRVVSANLDIESNDSSQDAPAFLSAFAILRHFNSTRAAGLIRQCLKPLLIRNPEDQSSFVELAFDGPIEGSGSVLTTLLNHLGSALIAASVFFELIEHKDPLVTAGDDLIEGLCKKAASVVGHSITYDSCMIDGDVNFHHLQFLKRSPFKSNNQWLPYMNLGCILRSLGSVDDNLEPQQVGLSHSEFVHLTNEQRINLRCGAIINGWKYEPTNPIIKALRDRFGSITNEISLTDSQRYVFNMDKESPNDYSSLDNTYAIRQRYGVSDEELEVLAGQIRNIHVGQLCRSTAMAKILNIDYGVKYL